MVNILTPAPGTELYQRLHKENRLLSFDWWRFNGEHVCFKPLLMSDKELCDGRIKLLISVFSYKKIYQRLKNLWKYNLYVKRDKRKGIFRKSKFYIVWKGLVYGNIFHMDKIMFLFKFLFKLKSISIFSVVMALNFHDYIYRGYKKIYGE